MSISCDPLWSVWVPAVRLLLRVSVSLLPSCGGEAVCKVGVGE